MNRFQNPAFWFNEARVCEQYSKLCVLYPSQFAEGRARDPEYWKGEAKKARRTMKQVEKRAERGEA